MAIAWIDLDYYTGLIILFKEQEGIDVPFYRLYFHLVWATKNREPLINPRNEARLSGYLRRKVNELECQVFSLNGWIDHVHLVLSIHPKLSVAEVVKRLKGASSHDMEELVWQRGYGALTVGERHLSIAVAYVDNQKNHHSQQTTNIWLEICNEIGEMTGDKDIKIDKAIRDSPASYQKPEDLPF